MPSSRRALLASLGTALAGCTAPRDGSRSSPTATASADASIGETVRADGVRVTVSDPVVTHSIRYLTAPDALGVVAAAGQFVVCRVSVEGGGSPPASEDFRLVVDGSAFAPGVPAVGPARVDAPLTGRRYGHGRRRGYLAIGVPTPRAASAAAVVLDGSFRWSLPAATLEPLRSPPPSFTTSVSVPDRVRADEPISVRLEVTNDGGVAGVFRGAINHRGPLYAADPFAFPVAAGASVTHETRVDYHVGESAPPARVQFGVVGPGLSRSAAVDVAGGGTPGGTTAGPP